MLLASVVFPMANANAAQASTASTQSPIKHTIVIYQENRSFDSYFGTYPNASGFKSLPGTPSVNGIPMDSFNLDENGNKVTPWLAPNNDQTLDVNHHYDAMMKAVDNGKMDQFYMQSELNAKGSGTIAMSYNDYHNIPAYWQYAQHYTLADNWYQPVYGPSTPGALYLVAAQSGAKDKPITGDPGPKNNFGGDAKWPGINYNLTYKNIGDEMTDKNISWGWYQGGYAAKDDSYSAHHNPFQYFQNYEDGKYNNNLKDYNDFAKDVDNGTLPTVAFVKGAYGDDEHPGKGNQSTPGSEDFSVKTINKIMSSKYWNDTAIVITYDESGGYWDHVAPPQVTPGPDGLQGEGPRIPAIVISPYAKENYVSHVQYDTTSILKFIEWNYGLQALNNRDANASNMLDMFNFDHPNFTPYIYSMSNDTPVSQFGTAVKVSVNNAPMSASMAGQGAFIGVDGKTKLPLLDLARSLNADLSYDAQSRMISMMYNHHLIQFTLGSNSVIVDGQEKMMTTKLWISSMGHAYISADSLSIISGITTSSNSLQLTIETN